LASNQALRTQLEARIDRVGQISQDLLYVKVLTPLFRLIDEKHTAAKTLEDALKAMVKDVPHSELQEFKMEFQEDQLEQT